MNITKEQTAQFILNTVSLLANKYNVKFEVDMKTNTVDFIGGTDKDQLALAQDLDKILGKYIV